jgi:hypothetical protein
MNSFRNAAPHRAYRFRITHFDVDDAGRIAAVVAIITAGAVAAATTMAGGIIATGGDL